MPGLDSRTAPLKQTIKDISTAKGVADSLNMLIDLYNTNQAVFIVQKFHDAGQAKRYLNLLVAEKAFSGYGDNELQPMLISYKNYTRLYSERKPDAYQSFYNVNYK